MMLLAHLWQSTLCAGLAALLAASLPHAKARIRHRIWLLASAKLMMPFALLVSAGGTLGSWMPAAAAAASSASTAARSLDQAVPFWSLHALRLPGSAGPASDLTRVFTFVLLSTWAAGAASIAWWRWRGWLSLRALVRASTPLESGREAEALRRAERHWPLRRPIALLACDANVEPGVRGVRRPQVLWPAGLSQNLDDAELEVILAHEVCHVHRRDNAVAMLQAIVESLFWFHPVVWRLSAQLVSERERACDEEVLQMGADRRNYAAGILKVCGFCLGSPVECLVGISRSGLAGRIVRIMEHHPSEPLPTSLRAVLAGVGVLMVAAPLMTGVLAAGPRPGDVADSRALLLASDGQQTVYRASDALKLPRLVKEFHPTHTREAMRARIQGGVSLDLVVLADGSVGKVTVTRSLDTVYGLDDEAVKTVKQWRFEPGTKNGKAVPVLVQIEMTFTVR